MKLRAALVVTLLVVAAVSAGCLGASDDKKKSEPVKRGTVKPKPATPTVDAKDVDENEVNRTLGKRWHFHNYWGLNPNLTLFDQEVAIEAAAPTASAPPLRATLGQATFGLPYGRIVPPETGTVTVTLHYNESPVLGPLNVSYKPANVDEFLPAGRAGAGGSIQIPVAADMTDVPHRGRSVWQFRLTAAPTDAGVGIANGTVHVVVVATIGRPIFIDPPHIDHWGGRDTVPVLGAEAEVHAAKLPGGSYAQPPTASGAVRGSTALAEFPVVNGAVVPEGTKVLLVRLTWDGAPPSQVATPALAWREENAGSYDDSPAPVSDKEGERLYRIPVLPRQTDSPYANQSTWVFRVLLNGDANAFSGTVRVDAWASQLPVDTAPFPSGPAQAEASADSAIAVTPRAAASAVPAMDLPRP